MISPDETATLVMDNVPQLMRLLRAKFQEKRSGELSMAQFRTLAFINANQGASLSDVSGHIGLGLPSMSKLVDALVTRELLTREMHGSDRRRICLALTPRGKRELDEAYQYTESFFASKFAQLGDEERTQVALAFRSLQRLFELDSKRPTSESTRE